jgi:diguanylate cyclase (GGDEF)-like protein/PAS domain S-box-containing protein
LRGVRGHVALLCVLVAAPLLALLASGAVYDHVEALSAASRRTVELARLGADQQSVIVREVGSTLRLLGEIPSVRNAVPVSCATQLRAIVDDDAQIDSFTVAHPDGMIACSTRNPAPGMSLSDRAYFRQALNAALNAPPATEIVVGRATHRSTIAVALPVLPAGPGQKLQGVIVATLNLHWLAQLAADIPDQLGHLALVIDPLSGEVLARAGQAIPPYGGQEASPALLAALRLSPAGGTTDVASGKVVPVIFGFAPITVGSRHLMLAVGLSRKDVLIAVNDRLRIGEVLALVTTLATILISWLAATRFILRPITALAAAARRFGTGELTARAPTRASIPDLRRLGVTFNGMADDLEVRNQQRAALQERLARSEENYRLLANNSTDMITRFGSDFQRLYVSPSCFELLGYTPEELIGHLSAETVHPDDGALLDTLNAPLKAGQARARATYRAVRKDGTSIWLETRGQRLATGEGYVMVTRDVSERKAFEEKLEAANDRLEELAAHDPLTALANRRRFEEVIESEHRRAKRFLAPLSLVAIDVDYFKAYNDTYGHPAGDACLKAVAKAVDGAIRRPGDFAARMGGEEFSVLLPATDAAGASVVATSIHDAVLELRLAHIKSPTGFVTISVGVATALSADDSSVPMLFRAADNALYAAKRGGRNTIRTVYASTRQLDLNGAGLINPVLLLTD